MSKPHSPSALVFNIKRSSMEDGPGIRTNIFLKGCPLRCLWCCNPEGQELYPELDKDARVKDFFERVMTTDEVMGIIRQDAAFYKASGGGITLAGGEPTMHVEFVRDILLRCRAAGFHTALDTCGYALGASAELLNLADMLLYDLKIIDEEKHIQATGCTNWPIIENFHRMGKAGKPMIVRFPLIPGYTDSEDNVEAVAKLVKLYPSVERIDIIPFHNYAIHKYEILKKPQILDRLEHIPEERIEIVKAFMEGFGIKVQIGG